jgi:long-subunit acyl-CoA synthetase (AMP-forming)
MSGMSDPDATAPERFRCFGERIVGHAEAEPDRIVIGEPGRVLTGGEFAGLVARLARGLDASGLNRGTRVAILATISPEALAVRYGAATLGCTTVFCPNTGDRSRLRKFLVHVRAGVLVVFPETAAAAAIVLSDGSVGTVMSVGVVVAPVGSVVRRRRSLVSCAATLPPVVAISSIGPAPPSGTRTGGLGVRSRRSWP